MRTPLLFATVFTIALVGAVCAQEPTTAEGYLKRGDDQKKSYAYDKAIADYTKAIELDKSLAQAYKQRAQVYCWTGKYDRAIEDYNAAIKSGAAEADTFLARGRAHSSLGKTDQALADYNAAIQCDPKCGEAYIARAWFYANQNKHEKAVADFDKVIELNPSVSNYQARAGYYHWNSKNLKAAIADYTKVIELEPRIASHRVTRASAYWESQELDLALADYTKAIELEPKASNLYTSRASLYLQKNRPDDAIADCTSALAVAHQDDFFGAGQYEKSHCHLLRGEAEKRKGNVDQATADFNKAIEYTPVIAGRVYLYQQKVLPDIFNFDSVTIISRATNVIKRDPKDVEAHIRRAAMHQLWDPSKAIEDYSTALKLAPNRAALYVCRGAAYQQAGRYASAVADYREALQLEPKMKLAESLLNASIAKLAEYKSNTTLESVRLDEEVFFVTTAVEKITLPEGGKKVIKKTLTTKHEVTVADVRKLDVEVRNSLKQKQESTSGNSSTSKTSESTSGDGGGSLNLGFLSFSGRGGKSWETSSESGYTSNTLAGWETEFGTTIRTGMEKSKAWTSSFESSEGVEIEVIGKGDDQPILVIYQDKYRSGTAKMKINGVDDEVRFTFPVGKDLNWKYAPKPKPEEKK